LELIIGANHTVKESFSLLNYCKKKALEEASLELIIRANHTVKESFSLVITAERCQFRLTDEWMEGSMWQCGNACKLIMR
jgi:hypothetical protein